MLRIAYLAVYAGLAAVGEGLVARPALLWLRGQGIFHAALPWEVPLGGLALALAALVAIATLSLASDAALGRRPRVPQHAAFLVVLGTCLALRAGTAPPAPPRDPGPALLQGLRAAADEIDRDFHGQYAPDAGQINGALAQVTPPGFRRLGRAIPLHARVIASTHGEGPVLDPLPGEVPATVYIAVSKDRTTAWLTAVTLHSGQPAILRTTAGKPVLVKAHSGTHSLPGRDPVVPAYPGMRGITK
ncbi:MAG TPA: hypothetical protein VF993_09855 [Myxococcales bacterium]